MIAVLAISLTALTVYAEDSSEVDVEGTMGEGEAQDAATVEASLWTRLREAIDGGQLLEAATVLFQVLLAFLVFMSNKLSKSNALAMGAQTSKIYNQGINAAKNSQISIEAITSRLAEIESTFVGIVGMMAELKAVCEERAIGTEQFNSLLDCIGKLAKMHNNVYSGSSTIPAAIKEQNAKEYNVICDMIEGALLAAPSTSEEGLK